MPKNKSNVIVQKKDHSTLLPHKTIATRAGIGWIGKCALLVTEQFGSAIRISSVLTDAPLETGEPINQSRCASCDVCVRNCPANALSGALWTPDLERTLFYNPYLCRKKALEKMWKVSAGESLCGLCILVCPWTRKFIQSQERMYNFPSVDMVQEGDLEEILSLQKLAYQSEAAIYNDYNIAPLHQTMEELKEEAKHATILKVVEDKQIVGSIRAFQKEETCHIGKIIVHPQYQNKGIGKRMISAMEKCYKGLRFELFTGYLSQKNLTLYQNLGYKPFKTEKISDQFQMIYLEK